MDTNELPHSLQGDPDSNGPLGERYALGEVIGRGAMAVVYRARDEVLGREVAVKLFSSGPADEEHTLRQQTEIQILSVFDHPGLVRLYDAGLDYRDPASPHTFLVMELVDGPDLRQRLSEGPIPAVETALLGAAVADALAHVHNHGVIHRDIKPANIILPAGEASAGPKLADFGIARLIEGSRLTATGSTVGTATYLSPEQATGSALTPASDIYSLGLVLIECLTGRPEYPGTPVESAVARLHRAPEIPPGLSAGYAELLASMTDIRPEYRPSAEQVSTELSELAAMEERLLNYDVPTAALPALPHVPTPPQHMAETASLRFHERQARRRAASRLGKVAAVLVGGIAAAVGMLWMTTTIQGVGQDTGDRSSVIGTSGADGTPTPTPTPTPEPTPAPIQTVEIPGPVQTLIVPAPAAPAPAVPSADTPGNVEKGSANAEKGKGKPKEG
ncbi:serine/threonine-protein kinase [Arthrobacter sp. ISL-30]|uniref:serine/threonine-protein kinase n=1 Tax=Arthrobacter sp. ISL-30 TaxID=2819109 RepID=UPI001BE745DB|nr:serine/threonine-protein kinase [Arthrobacter sp. ISL-30]MBT2512284.1 serine/threonine protein kinase [Arthrobacter sp. ISL-30]